jgi:hypothetical protein
MGFCLFFARGIRIVIWKLKKDTSPFKKGILQSKFQFPSYLNKSINNSQNPFSFSGSAVFTFFSSFSMLSVLITN